MILSRWYAFHVIPTLLLFSFSCKKQGSEPVSLGSRGSSYVADGDEEVKAKPDKVSEEASGIPGYPISCAWRKPPNNENTDAKLRCFISNEKGEPVSGIKNSVWSVDKSAIDATLTEEPSSTGESTLSLVGSSRADVVTSILDLKLSVSYDGMESKATGRELVKAEPNGQIAAAYCGKLFSMMLTDQYSLMTFGEFNRFEGCETLAAGLLNRHFPDPTVRALPSKSKTVSASCTDSTLNLTVTQPTLSGSTTQTTLNAEICKDAAAFINSLGL